MARRALESSRPWSTRPRSSSHLPTVIDIGAEQARLAKEIDKLQGEIGKLGQETGQ